MREFAFALLLIIPSLSLAASFDCKKAKSELERLICSNPELSQADSEMGAAYKLALKKFPYKSYIFSNQKTFLTEIYAKCNTKENCRQSAEDRTTYLKSILDLEVYGTEHSEGVFIVNKDSSGPTIQALGFDFPDAYNPGVFQTCDETFKLVKSGNILKTYENSEKGVGEPFVITIDGKTAEVSASYSCGARAFIHSGTYIRAQMK